MKQFKITLKRLGEMLAILIIVGLSSCSSSKNLDKTDYAAISNASRTLGMKISPKDNLKLFLEAASWIGVPYLSGGMSKSGSDCSGVSVGIYKNAFGIQLLHNSQMQLDKNVKKRVRKGDIQQGDLVFFSPKKSKKKINHVGIYLKDGKFIHASSSKGVRIDALNTPYWKGIWVATGRILGE